VTGVLVCVLAFGLLIMIFALLVGLVVSGMVESFSKKAEKSEKDISVESGDESETFENSLLRNVIDPDPVTDPAYNLLSVNLFHEPEIEIHYPDNDK